MTVVVVLAPTEYVEISVSKYEHVHVRVCSFDCLML